MARLGSGREDGPVVRFEKVEVVGNVLGVIDPRRACDAKFGRDKRGGQFSGDFFGDIGGIAFADLASKFGPLPVSTPDGIGVALLFGVGAAHPAMPPREVTLEEWERLMVWTTDYQRRLGEDSNAQWGRPENEVALMAENKAGPTGYIGE